MRVGWTGSSVKRFKIMQVEQKKWTVDTGWTDITSNKLKEKPQLVLVFGGTAALKVKKNYEYLKSLYPGSNIIACSTAGEIIGTEVLDNSIVSTAVYFSNTRLKFAQVEIKASTDSIKCGKELAGTFDQDGLVHVMVFSDGLLVNGTDLVDGLEQVLPKSVSVTGGLVGDGADFKETLTGFNELPASGRIVAVGFYGSKIRIGYGSLGGWDAFGLERTITKSAKNVLYELDGKPALALYKEYLGDKAAGLPSTALLFPLRVKLDTPNGVVEVVRTILAVDEKEQSMTFAGDMPEGSAAALMKANPEMLISGAEGAAKESKSIIDLSPDLAILVSCIGRKLVLKERTEEELEAVRGIFGENTALAGFYSYGEICPIKAAEKQCQLHNQTMTITIFKE